MKLSKKLKAVKDELWAWLKKNDLLTDTWWEVADDGNLRVLFEGDFYNVIWPAGCGERENQLHCEFLELLERHECQHYPLDNTSIRILENKDDPANATD